MKSLFRDITLTDIIMVLAGSILLAFGLYQVHSISGVTEGGILGMTLLLEHWFKLSPAVSGFVMNVLCYFLGWRLLGKRFVVLSLIGTVGFSSSYAVFEQYPHLFPELARHPLAAAVVGALFVGVSVGICVRVGAAPGGDDALAMSLSKLTDIDIQWIYLASDLTVLVLSLSYIPLNRILYSLLTVFLSGQLIGVVQKVGRKKI